LRIFDKKICILGETASTKKKSNQINAVTNKANRPKEKGLRKLSGKAFQIVKELGEVTYKTVALRLINEIQENDSEVDDVIIIIFRKERKTTLSAEFMMH
jgi:hypothetical protein